MTDDATEWVTVKVPRADKEKAKEYRPEGATFGDCLRTGAERLNDHRDSDPAASVTAEVTPVVDEDALSRLTEQVEDAMPEDAADVSELHEDVRDTYAMVEQANHKLDAIQEVLRG